MTEDFDYRFINLSHRKNRRRATERNLEEHGFDIQDKRLDAVYCPELPSAGAAMSHYLALADLFCRSDATHFLVIEDDWRFKVSRSFLVSTIASLTKTHPEWDVLQLSATDSIFSVIGTIQVHDAEATTVRIHKATSAAAYLVRREFALTLSGYFAQSMTMQEENAAKLKKVNANYYKEGGNQSADSVREKVGLLPTALDHAWGFGQLIYQFIGTSLQFGYCEPLESDISQYVTDNYERQLATVLQREGLSPKGSVGL